MPPSFSVAAATPAECASVDALVFPVGYERRATFVARDVVGPGTALFGLAFPDRQVHDFANNLAWAQGAGAEVQVTSDTEFGSFCDGLPLKFSDNVRTLGVDVSSFSRDRIGRLVEAGLQWCAGVSGRRLTFIYAPSRFDIQTAHDAAAVIPLGTAELLRGYEGDPVDTNLPLVAVIGLGFEAGRALGARELLEPAETSLWVPRGVSKRFDSVVGAANAGLFVASPHVTHQSYDIMDPAFLFEELARLAVGVAGTHQCVLVPLGPKIFATVACLVSRLYVPHLPVWRISGGASEDARPSAEAGLVTGLHLMVAPELRPALTAGN